MIKQLLTSIFFSLLFLSSFAQPNTWLQKASLGLGNGTAGAASFSIGNYGYVATGGGDTSDAYRTNTWQYDPVANTWTQKADVDTIGRIGATGFAIGNYGYLGFGINDSNVVMNDFWQYNPVTNTWLQRASLPGPARCFAASFVIGTYGYICTGESDGFQTNQFNDLWEYSPASNTWTQKVNFPATARGYAMAFSIGGFGYVGGGTIDDATTFQNDYWKYDPSQNSWSAIASFPAAPRAAGSTFTFGTAAYVGLGYADLVGYDDFWKFNSLTNSWIQKASFGGGVRDGACSFVLGNKAYVCCGEDTTPQAQNDLWEYTPDSVTTGIADLESAGENILYPNPFHENALISIGNLPIAKGEKVFIRVYDMHGIKVRNEEIIFSADYIFHRQSLTDGLYYYEFYTSDNRYLYGNKFVLQ